MAENVQPKRSRLLEALIGSSRSSDAQQAAQPANGDNDHAGDTEEDSEQEETIRSLKRKIYGASDAPDQVRAGPSKRRVLSSSVYEIPDEDEDDDDGEYEDDVGSSPRRRAPTLLDASRAPTGNSSLFNFRLRYNEDVKPRPLESGGADQEKKMKEFLAKSFNDMNNIRGIKKSMENLGLKSMADYIPGLEVRLLPHQIIGVSWMLDQERKSPHKGGILADDMGLGKTVQMIATMVMNAPSLEEEHRTTLIIVPAALLEQWKEELETKTNGMFTVRIHHGRTRLRAISQVAETDVIITTYQTLAVEFSVPKNVDEAEDPQWIYSNGGIIARSKFFRVVCDEAQFIRNRSTRSSIVAAMIRAPHRWALTGTPVTNSLVDLYGLIRFGRFRPWNDWNDFNLHIAKQMERDAPLASARAQEVLKPLLLRRTKNSKREDGSPLLQLPKKDIELVRLDFTDEEREIYESIEQRARVRINRFIKRGTLLKENAAVMVMILRLRQLCCHPYLILSLKDALEDPSLVVGSQADKELARAKRLMGIPWVNKIKAKFMLAAQMETFGFRYGATDQVEGDSTNCPMCQDVYTSDSGRVLECGHQMCFECLMELSTQPLQTNEEVHHGEGQERDFEAAIAKGHRPCPVCKKLTDLHGTHVFRSYAFEPSEDEVFRERRARKEARQANKTRSNVIDVSGDDDGVEEVNHTVSKKRRLAAAESDDELDAMDAKSLFAMTQSTKGKGKEVQAINVDDEEDFDDKPRDNSNSKAAKNTGNTTSEISKQTRNTWSRGGSDMEASSKMVTMVELLKEWETTGDRTIIYSQWTSLLDLIENVMARHGMRSLRYDGKISCDNRGKVLREFRRFDGPKVILISIKCGGVGLNLTNANRVINMDLSWNYATESQAYDRVHRLGQEKEVVVKRLIMNNTIEDRMLYLQDVKTGLSDAALGEGSAGTRLHKLSVKEIKLLFGMSDTLKKQMRDLQRNMRDSELSSDMEL